MPPNFMNFMNFNAVTGRRFTSKITVLGKETNEQTARTKQMIEKKNMKTEKHRGFICIGILIRFHGRSLRKYPLFHSPAGERNIETIVCAALCTNVPGVFDSSEEIVWIQHRAAHKHEMLFENDLNRI